MQRKQNARCSLRLLPQQRFIHYTPPPPKKKPTQPKPNFQAPIQNQVPPAWSALSQDKVLACLQLTFDACLSSPSPAYSYLLFPSSQACWNLNFKWTPSMATIDRKGAFDCSCVAEKKGGDSSWLWPSRNSSSTAPQPLQWDAFACSYSFKLPASMFPFKEDEFFRFPLLRN